MITKWSHLSVVLAAIFLGLAAGADTYDEKLEFLETTGTQWVDTGLRLNFRRARLEAHFRMLEIPDSVRSLCGALDKKDTYGGRDYDKGATLRSFAVRVGYTSNPDIKNNRILCGWTGGEGPGFVAAVDTTGGYEVKIDCTTGSVNRTVSCGAPQLDDYSWRYRPDELIGEGKTYYIGNINNAGEGLGTASGSMPKVHWYGLRLWHDDTLIGDFIPVKKNGVAGFFDNVTETFFPSQGDDPFVAPNRIVWTGNGAADNMLDGANWQGGVAPSTPTDVAVFPAGVTVDGTYTDIATLATIGGVDVQGVNTLLRFASATQSPGKAWAAPFFGKGSVRFANVSSYGCSFNADSSAFEGLLDISNSLVNLNRLYAFGGAKANVRYYSDVSGQRLNVYTQLAPLSPTFTFLRTGQFVFADVGAHFAGTVVIDQVGGLTFNGNGDHAIVFSGPVTNRATAKTTCTFDSAHLQFTGVPKHLGKLCMRANIASISTPLGCEAQPKSAGIKDQTNLGIWPASSGIKFEADDVLGEYASLLINWDYNLYDSKKRHVNLNGHDQTIGTLGVHSENWFYWNDPTKNHFATNTIIRSDTPATLTLAGYCRNSILYPEKNYVYPGQLNGALSFVLDSRADVMATAYDSLTDNRGIIRFTSALSTTTGTLASKRGLIDIRSQAAFSNLTELAVMGEGQIHARTAAIGVANEGFRVALTNVTTGKLEIDAGLVLEANTAVVGTGRWLPPGDYSSVASPGVSVCPQLAGEGILRVRTYGGKKGLVLMLR